MIWLMAGAVNAAMAAWSFEKGAIVGGCISVGFAAVCGFIAIREALR